MGTYLTILNVVGHISAFIVAVSLIAGVIMWFRGILPVLLRLGNGLVKRKIAIFAKGDNLTSLNNLLIDSKLFRQENIMEISTLNDLGKAESASVYLVFWPDYQTDIDIDGILEQKEDGTALIVYSPRNLGPIPDDQMNKLDGERNTAVVNFRGRLLSDIFVSMITTRYKQ